MVEVAQRPPAAAARGAAGAGPRRAWPWPYALLAAALLFGAGLRLFGLNWDDGAHLHPDEREITMVAERLHWPRPEDAATAADRGGHSALDPRFFAYGSLPLYLLAASGNVAHHLGTALTGTPLGRSAAVQDLVQGDNYAGMNLVGRFLSAVFDTVSILLCFLLGRRVYGPAAGALAAAGYAATALAVQQAHFYVVDPILTCFALATLNFCLRSLQAPRPRDALLAGVFYGFAVATKVSAAPLGLAVLLAQVLPLLRLRALRDGAARRRLLGPRLDGLVLAALAAAVAFLASEPYAILDWSQITHDLTEQSAMVRGLADLPYTRQYAPTRPYLYWLEGLVAWQMAPPLALAGLAGLLWQVRRALRAGHDGERLLVSWFLPYLLLTGAFYAKFPRYLLPAAPLLCIAAGGMLWSLAAARSARWRRVGAALIALTLGVSALYCLAYEHIYAATNTRVAASDWIYRQVPASTDGHRTVITHEVWDDGLPLDRGSVDPAWSPGRYAYADLPIYDDDTPQKQQTLIADLQRADYVVEASEIVRGSILRNPGRYPMTVAYYRALDDGRLGFAKVAEFRSVPQLFGLRLDDRDSDLNWQFYDHPPVTVYRKVRRVAPAEMAALFPAPGAAPVAAAPAAGQPSLQLTPAAAAADAASPALGQMFPPEGLGMRFPLPVWLFAVELLGLLALPWSIRLLRALPDAGYCGSKALGILLVGWAVWLAASVGIANFTRGAILLAVAVLAAASLAGWLTLEGGRDLLRRYWRLWLAGELVFLAAFALFLAIRAFNPDLWQLYRGGEKPMELSYLHAILRSQVFPPFDPWLSGTTINYYYFGLYLVAMLLKLTAIAPETGFNLAIPLLYGLAMQLAAAAGYALTGLLLERPWAVRPEAGGGLPRAGRQFPLTDGPPDGDVAGIGGFANWSSRTRAALGALGASFWPSASAQSDDGGRTFRPPDALQVRRGPGSLPPGLRSGGESLAGGTPAPRSAATVDGHGAGHARPAGVALRLDRLAALGGLFAALLFGILGNLDSVPYLLGQVHEAGAAALPAFNYFDRTRVIPFTINEFPFFSFLYADLHPHVIDMPYELLSIAFAIGLVMGGRRLQNVPLGPAALLLGALVIGALWPINVWDFPTFLLLAAGAMWLRRFDGRNALPALLPAGLFALALALLGRLLFLPFYRHFYALESGLAMPAHHSDIWHYALVYGLFFTIAGTVLLLEQGLSAEWLALLLLPALLAGFVSGSAVIGLLVGLLLLGARAAWLRRFRPNVLAALLPLALALCVLLGIELVFIKDPLQGGDWQRMNTVFKFGLQAWLLLSVCCGPFVVWLAARRPLPFRAPALAAAAGGLASDAEALGRPNRDPARHAGPVLALAAAAAPAAAMALPHLAAEVAGDADPARPSQNSRDEHLVLDPGGAELDGAAGVDVSPIGDARKGEPSPGPDRAALAEGGRGGATSGAGLAPTDLAADGRGAKPAPRALLPAWWWALLTLLVAGAAIYPLAATPARLRDRWQANAPTPSLDGMAFMRTAVLPLQLADNQTVDIPLAGDYAAISWLQQHIRGIPVLLEANKDIYAWYDRVSWFTGLPTVLGWDNHTGQFHDPALIPPRKEAITTIYTTTDRELALSLIRQYHIELIYVGALERATYGGAGAKPGAAASAAGAGTGGLAAGAGLAKFDAMVGSSLDLIYDAQGVKIYRVRGGA